MTRQEMIEKLSTTVDGFNTRVLCRMEIDLEFQKIKNDPQCIFTLNIIEVLNHNLQCKAMFCTNDYCFGVGVLPKEYKHCAMAFPSKYCSTFDEYLETYCIPDTKVLYSIGQVVDYAFPELQ